MSRTAFAFVLLIMHAASCAHEPATKMPPPPECEGEIPPPCDPESDEARACVAQGDDFAWGKPDMLFCSGVQPRPEDRAAHECLAQRVQCQCYSISAKEEERSQCSLVPSAPPQ